MAARALPPGRRGRGLPRSPPSAPPLKTPRERTQSEPRRTVCSRVTAQAGAPGGASPQLRSAEAERTPEAGCEKANLTFKTSQPRYKHQVYHLYLHGPTRQGCVAVTFQGRERPRLHFTYLPKKRKKKRKKGHTEREREHDEPQNHMEQRAGKAHTGVLTTFLKCETTTETSKQPSAAAGHRGVWFVYQKNTQLSNLLLPRRAPAHSFCNSSLTHSKDPML